MKWLLGLNIVATVLYASFVAALLIADAWIFPKLAALTSPPEAVRDAIQQGSDAKMLRQIALLLFDHVTEQVQMVSNLIDRTVLGARLHFLLSLSIASVNVALLLHVCRTEMNATPRTARER